MIELMRERERTEGTNSGLETREGLSEEVIFMPGLKGKNKKKESTK